MATINNGAPLGDPRKRWLSSGSQNQQQSFYNKVYQPQGQQKPQGTFNPYAGTPLEANDGTLYKPKGQPDAWEPTGQVNYDPNDPMGGWDYRNPPVNNQGVPLDFNGNPLPAGATGWNPHGEPDFTPLGRTDLAASFEGWFKGIQYRLHQGADPAQEKNPFVSAAETAAGYLEKGDFKQGLPAAWNFLMQVGPGLRELGGDEEGAPTLATYAGRTIAEMGRGIGSAFGLFSKTAESLIGAGQLTMQDAQEGSPLPDINYPDWMPGWATAITDTVGPLAAYNSLRVLTAPKKSWDEARDNLDENWQASRIAYSVLNDVTLKDEYVRRYKSGENPAYLATELQKPIDEMVGQLILDPLNAAGFFTRAGVTARRLGKVEDIFVNPSTKVDEAFKALRANTVAEGASALENLAQAVKDQVGKVSANLDELAQNRGLLQLTTEGKRQDLANRSGQMVRFVFANTRKADGTYDFDKAMEIMRALVLKTDDNLSAVAEGVDILTHAPVPKPLFSRAADELGVILRNHLIDATQPAGQTPLPGMRGNLDFSAFLRGFEEAKAGGLDGVVQWATSKLDESAKAYFPTVLEQADAIDRFADYQKTGTAVLKPGETLADLERYANLGAITPAQRFISRFDKMTKGAIYTPINRFFANVYMGMSPGFAFRNLMNNALTISVDAGAGSIFVSKEKAVNGVRELLGGVTNAKMGGFGGIGSTIEGVGEAEQGYKWWQFGLKKSAEFEELGAAQISYKAVKDVMRQMLRPGKALPDIAPLVDAGMDTQTANLLTRLVLEYDGNVDKALARFRELAAPGNIEITKTALWLGEEDIRIAQNFNVWEQMKAIYQGEGTLAEKQAKITALAVDTEKFADAAKFEQTGATDMLASLEGNNILLNASEATAQGLMSDAESAIANHRVWANAYTRRAYENLVTTIRREAVSLVPEFAKQVDETGTAMLNQMDSLWSGTNNTHELFTKQVWARTQELRSGKGTATIPQLWDEFKMTGEPFAGMGKDEFLDALWNHWRTETRTRWATTREAYAAFGETYWQNVRKISGYEPSKALLDQAREALAQARAFDDAVVETTSKGPLVFQTKDKILSALGRGDAKTAIAILADHYGISSATAKGTFYDKQILNTFRAYSGRNKAFSLTDALKPLAELPEEFARALADEARMMLDEFGASSGTVNIPKPLAEPGDVGLLTKTQNPVWYVDLQDAGYKNKTTIINALKRIVDGKDGGDFSYLRAVKEAVFDRLQQQSGLYPELERILSGKGKDFSNLTLEDVWRAFEAQRTAKGKGTLIENLDAYLSGYISRQKIDNLPPGASFPKVTPLDTFPASPIPGQLPLTSNVPPTIRGAGEAIPSGAPALANTLPPTQGTMPGFTTPGGLTVGPDGNPIPLRTPYMDGSMPTGPRATAENLAGLKDWLNRVNQKLSDNWGTLTPADFSPKVEQALGGWKAQATERIGEARLLASGYADVMRDFALHDYSQKKNLDLVAAYLFPYEFWYTRTYKNWLTRLVSNPETIAAYAKYRTALEHLHAGSPEWWKYNINSNELLGRNDDNPLFFNLEATLNPLNGLTGTDFNDPAKRVDWLTRSLDDVGKFGPSTWTPLNFALALSLYAKGEQDAAARWAGRLIPQTATLRSIGAIFNQNLELDPFTHFFAGGQDPYEQRRVAMALAALAQGVTINGEYVQITDEQAIDAASPEIRAANPEAQAIWEQATQYALDKRVPGQLASFFLGVGFKGRNLSDIQIDKMYSEYYTLWNRSSDLNADEFRDLMDQLHTRYPWMDSILIAKKSGPEVDRALAYNVLGRIPPGQASDITKLIGIDPGIIEQFYANKGDLSFMTKPDRDRFMAGIVDLSALLALPENATREEWGMVRSDYKAMRAEGARLFGEDIWERVDRYFALNQANPDAAKLLVGNDPLLEKVLSWKEEQVMGNELLFTYYGGLDFLEKYYKGQKYATLDAQFPDIQSAWDGYNALKDLGDTKGARAYWNEHPELKAYLEASDTWNLSIEEKLDALTGKLREPLPGKLRQEFVQPQGSMQEQAAPAFGYNPPAPTWQDYQALISQDQSNLLEDYFAGGTLSPAMKKSLTRLAETLGVTYETLLFQMESSYYGEQVPANP